MLLETGFEELRPSADVARRVNVFVLERMIQVDGDAHAGDLRSPEEIPVLFDLERFVPADRLQDVAISSGNRV